jgi:hypothetical protein
MAFPQYGHFQTQINDQPAPAIEGDWASANPFGSMLAAPGSLQAGAAGVLVGRFAWAENDNQAVPGVVSNQHPGVASRLGFVGRDQAGVLITSFLGSATMQVQAGYEVTLYTSGDFWARFAGGATVGQKVYASFYDGSASSAATGAPTTQGITASLDNATSHMTVTVAGASPLSPGMPIAGTGVTAGTTLVSLVSGTAAGTGVWLLSAAPTTEAAEAVTVTLNSETPWTVQSTAAAGELAQIARP